MARRGKHEVETRLDVGSRMPDGVRLSNDIYLPRGIGECPVVLVRTPYSNNDPEKKIPLAREFAENGYAVVVQDVRGRYDSEGEWEPFFNEAADGRASQAWIAEQDFCNGSIVQMGRSYEGFCAWVSAFDHHPALRAIVPVVALPDPVRNVPWMNGSVFWNMITWAMFVNGRTNQDVGSCDWESLYGFRPLCRLDEELGFVSRPWRDWMAHPRLDAYWKRACYMDRVPTLTIPALHISGWYDDDGLSTIENYPTARRSAPSAADQYLVIGPWPHATNTPTIVPGVDFGPEETIDLGGHILDWLDLVVGGRPESFAGKPRALIFEMGTNVWRSLEDWPPPDAEERSFYLASRRAANSMLGDGMLIDEPRTAGRPHDSYHYDPDDPTPYLYDAGTLQVGGPFDARPVERRDDVLCYTTPVLEEALTICGRVFAELYVRSTAEDTEFCAKLVHVFANGTARQLCDGNIRLALRDGLERPDPVPPSTIVPVRIDLWATCVRIRAGDRIRLEVASSAVPKFAAHTNTLENPGTAVEVVIAENRVYHTEDLPSRLILTVRRAL